MTNLPNLLTLVRIFLVPLLVAALLQGDLRISAGKVLLVRGDLFALAVFLAAALTDLLDGYLARRWKQVTTVGTLLDPVADKLLISAALVSLVEIRLLPAWLVILIIGREFAVSGLRSIAAAEGFTIAAGELGKYKMVFQVTGVTLMLMSIHWPILRLPGTIAMWAVVLFGLLSAVGYFQGFWRKLDKSIKLRRRKELIALDRQKRRLARVARKQEREAADPKTAPARR